MAERIAGDFGNDGRCFTIGAGDAQHTLDSWCRSAGCDVSFAQSRWGEEAEEYVAHEAPRSEATDRVRYLFPDGSALVVSGDAWAVEGAAPFYWRG